MRLSGAGAGIDAGNESYHDEVDRRVHLQQLMDGAFTARSGCKGLFSEGGEFIKLHIEGSLRYPNQVLKGYNDGNAKIDQALEPDRADRTYTPYG